MRPIQCLKCDELMGAELSYNGNTDTHQWLFVNGCAEPIERCPGCGHDLGHLADCQQLKVLEGRLVVDPGQPGRVAA